MSCPADLPSPSGDNRGILLYLSDQIQLGGLEFGTLFSWCFLSDDYAELLRSSLWAGWAESDNRGMKWLFQDDYRDVVFAIFQSMCSFPDACSYHVDVIQSYSGGPLPLCSRWVNSVENIC